MSDRPFVPSAFVVPQGLSDQLFLLEPLGPQHNEADYAAWTSSIEHIRATPGFSERSWPHEMAIEENLADLESHARDFEARTGFTYSVLDPGSRVVVGCVYIYPLRPPDDNVDATVRSWVRTASAQLDVPLWRAVTRWLAGDWPFTRIEYAARD